MAQPKEVKRYRAGQRPLWDQDSNKLTDKSSKKSEYARERDKTADNRLARLENDIGDEQERLSRHRRIIEEAAVITAGDSDNATNEAKSYGGMAEKDDKEEDLEKRRERARKQKGESDNDDQVEELPVENDENEDDEESSSVSESDSGEEDWDQFMPSRGPRLVPRFVKKKNDKR